MTLIAVLAAAGIEASIEATAEGLFHARLCHPDGQLHVEHLALPSRGAAEGWLFANAEVRYRNTDFMRRAVSERRDGMAA